MIPKSLTAAGMLTGALLISSVASASPGVATGNVNMRSGPGTQYPVITTIPAGAPLEVFGCQSWCQVGYAGTQGYVSGNYVSGAVAQPRAYYRPAPRVYYDEPYYYQSSPGFYYSEGHPYRHDRHWRRDRWRGPGAGFYFQFGD
jgi:uncharacterized protein YraI